MTPQVADTRVPAKFIRSIYNNLIDLHIPFSEYNIGEYEGTSPSTTSGTFVDVHADEMRLKVIVTSADGLAASPGRDIFVVSNIVTYVTTADTIGAGRLTVDGVGLGDAALGNYHFWWNDQPQMIPLFIVVRGLLPGEHEIILQHKRSGGTGLVHTYIHHWHWIYAQET